MRETGNSYLKKERNSGIGGRAVDIRVGDILTMKKEHPCGTKDWKVLRVGMDFKLQCLGCGRQVMLPRRKAEQGIKSVKREETEV